MDEHNTEMDEINSEPAPEIATDTHVLTPREVQPEAVAEYIDESGYSIQFVEHGVFVRGTPRQVSTSSAIALDEHPGFEITWRQ